MKLMLKEYFSITTQIENILNSHPFSPLLSELEDYEVSIADCFLIGRPTIALPEPYLINERGNLLDQ